MAERTFTVAEVGRRVAQVVEERMAARFWVRGEVAEVSRSARGSGFLTLVESDGAGRVVARLPVTLSPGKLRLVDRRMARVGQPLAEGIEVRIRGHMEWWSGGGRLSVSLDDIDPAHTAGAMAVARRELLAALAAEGLLERQAGLPVPRLPLRLGLVTRGGSQAYHDLVHELSAGGLPFQVVLASAGVQGRHAPAELVAALGRLGGHGGHGGLDLILLTRGGGGEVDLSTFDHPDVARAVATCRVPVWTGIGHHLDTPVAEQVAARALKTPTALAQAVVAAALEAVGSVEATWAGIGAAAGRHLGAASGRLERAARRTQSARVVLRAADGRLGTCAHRLDSAAAGVLRGATGRLDAATGELRASSLAATRSAGAALDRREALVRAQDPARLLARGWSVTTTAEGALVSGPVPAGTRLRTRTRGGMLTSEVIDDAEDEG